MRVLKYRTVLNFILLIKELYHIMEFINTLFSLKANAIVLCGTFLIAFLGYALGYVQVKGLSLGTAGVFLTALLFGYLCTLPALENIPLLSKFYISESSDAILDGYGFLGDIGLVLFVTAVGFIAGPNFFRNLKKNVKSYVPLGAVIILTGAAAAVIFAMIPGIGSAFSTGILSGALTSTPAFSAAKQVAEASGQSGLVSLGQAIAYPFGVIGVVLFVQVMPRILKADIAKEREAIRITKPESTSSADKGAKETKKTALLDDFGFASFGIAVIFGILLGAIKIPLTGDGFGGACFSLGNTGGPLITALILGHFGHIGKLNLQVPTQVVKVFREFGLMLFLLGAGFEGGVELVAQIQASEYGAMLIVYGFLAGVVMTILPLVVGYFFAAKVFKFRLFDNLGALTGGMTSTPALGTLIKVAGTDDVAAAYASTYPVALILVVLASNLIGTFIA